MGRGINLPRHFGAGFMPRKPIDALEGTHAPREGEGMCFLSLPPEDQSRSIVGFGAKPQGLAVGPFNFTVLVTRKVCAIFGRCNVLHYVTIRNYRVNYTCSFATG